MPSRRCDAGVGRTLTSRGLEIVQHPSGPGLADIRTRENGLRRSHSEVIRKMQKI